MKSCGRGFAACLVSLFTLHSSLFTFLPPCSAAQSAVGVRIDSNSYIHTSGASNIYNALTGIGAAFAATGGVYGVTGSNAFFTFSTNSFIVTITPLTNFASGSSVFIVSNTLGAILAAGLFPSSNSTLFASHDTNWWQDAAHITNLSAYVAGVSSFMTRTGAVSLLSNDVVSAFSGNVPRFAGILGADSTSTVNGLYLTNNTTNVWIAGTPASIGRMSLSGGTNYITNLLSGTYGLTITTNLSEASRTISLLTGTASGAFVSLTDASTLPVLNGVNLVTLNASAIASGTLDDARLSGNVFTGAVSTTAGITLTTNGAGLLTLGGSAPVFTTNLHLGHITGTFDNLIITNISNAAGLTYAQVTNAMKPVLRLDYTNLFSYYLGNAAGSANTNSGNIAIGVAATVGTNYRNVIAIGPYAAANLQRGIQSIFIGGNAGLSVENGYADQTMNNTFVGYDTYAQDTSGSYNSGFGIDSMWSAKNVSYNSAFGGQTLMLMTQSIDNAALGYNAGQELIMGSSNVFVGAYSGFPYADVWNPSATLNKSVFVGWGAVALNSNDINTIVIGCTATGAGPNTVTLGNTSITNTFLRGTVTANGTNLITQGTFDTATNNLTRTRILYRCENFTTPVSSIDIPVSPTTNTLEFRIQGSLACTNSSEYMASVRFNGDSGAASYGWIFQTFSDGGSVTSIEDETASLINAVRMSTQTSNSCPFEIKIFEPAMPNRSKSLMGQNWVYVPGAFSSKRCFQAGEWYGTNVITNITLNFDYAITNNSSIIVFEEFKK